MSEFSDSARDSLRRRLSRVQEGNGGHGQTHSFPLTETAADRQSRGRLDWGLDNLGKTETEKRGNGDAFTTDTRSVETAGKGRE